MAAHDERLNTNANAIDNYSHLQSARECAARPSRGRVEAMSAEAIDLGQVLLGGEGARLSGDLQEYPRFVDVHAVRQRVRYTDRHHDIRQAIAVHVGDRDLR